MQLRDLLLVFHIAGAGAWLGANVVQAVAPRMFQAYGAEATAGWYRVAGRLSTRLYMPAAILILGTGVWLVLISDGYGFDSVFVTIGFTVIVIGALLGKLVFSPGSERAAEAVLAGDRAAQSATAGRLAAFGALDTLLILLAILVMVLRLGA